MNIIFIGGGKFVGSKFIFFMLKNIQIKELYA